MVEGFLDADDFLFAFLGEGALEVLSDEPSSVPYYII